MMDKFIKLIWALILLFSPICARTQGNCNVTIVDTIPLQKAYFVLYKDTMSDYNKRVVLFFEDTINLVNQQYITSKLFDDNYLYLDKHDFYMVLIINHCQKEISIYEKIKKNYVDSILVKKEYEEGLMTVYSIFSPLGFVKVELNTNSYYGASAGSLNYFQYKGSAKYLQGITPVIGIKREE